MRWASDQKNDQETLNILRNSVTFFFEIWNYNNCHHLIVALFIDLWMIHLPCTIHLTFIHLNCTVQTKWKRSGFLHLLPPTTRKVPKSMIRTRFSRFINPCQRLVAKWSKYVMYGELLWTLLYVCKVQDIICNL